MPSTRRQEAKARKSWEMDFLSVYGNIEIILGKENSTSRERVLLILSIAQIGIKASSPFLIEGVHLEKMRSELLISEMSLLGNMDFHNLLKFYKVK